MANEKNLIPFNERSKEEARESGRNGGKASGVSRRRKKTLKALMKQMLAEEITDVEIYNATIAMGVSVEDMTYAAALTAAMIREGASGNVKAFREIRELVGESAEAEKVKLLRDKDKREQQEAKDTAAIPVRILIDERSDDEEGADD